MFINKYLIFFLKILGESVAQEGLAFFPAQKVSVYKQTVCTYLCPSFTRELPNQSPTNFVQTTTPTQERFLAQV